MSPRKLALRVVKVTALAFVCLFLVLFITVRAQQWLLRLRAGQLMADMHQIRLYQTTWAEAQHLMHRWGAWGHYDGMCTSSDCQYTIALWVTANTARWLYQHKALSIYEWLGGRPEGVTVIFTVHNGTVWRLVSYAEVYVAPSMFSGMIQAIT